MRKIPLRESTRHPDGTRRLGGLGLCGGYLRRGIVGITRGTAIHFNRTEIWEIGDWGKNSNTGQILKRGYQKIGGNINCIGNHSNNRNVANLGNSCQWYRYQSK